MATTAEVIAGVRKKLRDFSKLFQTDVIGDGAVQLFELPAVMIEAVGLSVIIVNTGTTPSTVALATSEYTLDAHHGMLMLGGGRILTSAERLNVFGTHYEWFLDSDIEDETAWFVETVGQSINDKAGFFSSLPSNDPRFELIVRGVLIGCLWNLLIEASLDIDVRNPEGVDIPVSQRFAQAQNLVQLWTDRYEELASKLNIGIDRIQMMTLRRVSYSTGRYVPIYVAQEFDDVTTPQRLYPLIDQDQTMTPATP